MKPPAWSFSSLNAFETCPKQYYHYKVAKDTPEPPGEAAMWGTRFHTAAENYIKTGELEPEFMQYKDYFDSVISRGRDAGCTMLPEQKMALNRDMQPCDWFASDVWVRGIIDVLILTDRGTAFAEDWKTGKKKPGSEQLKLFALLVFAHYPEVELCVTTYRWVQDKTGTTDVFHRNQAAEMWQTFLPKLKVFAHAFKTENFPPKPSGLCKRYCAVTSCDYCGG